jgi:hypothetical protein
LVHDYQGDPTFLKEDLVATVKELLELQSNQRPIVVEGLSPGSGARALGNSFSQSTDTIANILGAKSGSGLAIAAAAHLHFVKKKPMFTRKEILAEMQAAPAHWKHSYTQNLTFYLDTLRGKKDRLRLVSKDTYALSNKEKQALEVKLAHDQ